MNSPGTPGEDPIKQRGAKMQPKFTEGHDDLRRRAERAFRGLSVRIAVQGDRVFVALPYGGKWWLVVPAGTDEWRICHGGSFSPCSDPPAVRDAASFRDHMVDVMTGA